VVQDDSTIAVRPVKTGPAEGEFTSIESGVKAGERVVTDGVDRFREGMKVEVAPPPGEKPAAPNDGGAGQKGARKKYQDMTPEERDAAKQRRQGKQGSSGQQVGK
jgi:multidrug efflux system membrane fusion protein